MKKNVNKIFCGCCDWKCLKTIPIDNEEYFKISSNNFIIISNQCKKGPEETDILIEKKELYSIYKEKE